MKFGIHILPTYMPEVEGPLPDFYRQMFDQIIEVEKLGFDQAWITDGSISWAIVVSVRPGSAS